MAQQLKNSAHQSTDKGFAEQKYRRAAGAIVRAQLEEKLTKLGLNEKGTNRFAMVKEIFNVINEIHKERGIKPVIMPLGAGLSDDQKLAVRLKALRAYLKSPNSLIRPVRGMTCINQITQELEELVKKVKAPEPPKPPKAPETPTTSTYVPPTPPEAPKPVGVKLMETASLDQNCKDGSSECMGTATGHSAKIAPNRPGTPIPIIIPIVEKVIPCVTDCDGGGLTPAK